MATYELPISSPITESGDDVYCKPTDSDFTGGGTWVTSVVAAIEVEDTNVYLATLDETKGYLVYLNGTFNSFTANAGTDVLTDNAHGLSNGETLRFKGADLPAPLEQSTLYYVRDSTTNTFKVAATAGGTAIDIADVGSGTMSYVAPSQRSKTADVLLGTVPVRALADIAGEAEIAEILAQLDLIQAKTDLIGAGGQIGGDTTSGIKILIRLTRNDAYNGTANAAKTFTVTKDYTSGWTGTLTIKHRQSNVSLLSKAVVVTSSVLLTVSLTSSDTAFTELTTDDDFGPHPFDIEMVSGSSKQTAIKGIAIITKDQTTG